jgi:hypothetical protein
MDVERIKFERTGGFAGIRLAADFEVNNLPDDQRREILELLDEMDLDELTEKLPRPASVPDGFVYSISIESEHREYRVTVGDSEIPDEMQSLLEILERMAKRQMRKN